MFIAAKGALTAPDQLRVDLERRRPGETAFVLAQGSGAAWRYLGVGRWSEDESLWRIPEVDYATWRKFGDGKEVSRSIPAGVLARAELVVEALVAAPEAERWIEQPNGRRARILGRAQRGGLRIDGGTGGFAERTVSLLDIGWVIATDDDVEENGGPLDEERVNRLRYLDGTPKGSTRWIDTGWAIAAWTRGMVRSSIPTESSGPHRPRRADGTDVNADFRVERVHDALTVVIESRGGTSGSQAERNRDYNEGFEVVLSRLKEVGARLTDVQVESRATEALPPQERRLELEGRAYPIAIDDPPELRRRLGAAQARVGRAPGARGGGNQTRRLRVFVELAEMMSVEDLAARLRATTTQTRT